jgi:hypothetical protein
MATALRFLRSDPPYLPGEVAWFGDADARRLVASGAAQVVAPADDDRPAVEAPADGPDTAPALDVVTKPIRAPRRKGEG